MKKLIILLTLAANVTIAGNEGPGGGAGFKIEGEYLTFGSAKVKIEREIALKEIPGMDLLLTVVDQMALPLDIKNTLRNAIFPSQYRQYFLLENLSPESQVELKKKFIEAIGKDQDKGEIVIYAITTGYKTFLLPTFEKIKKESGKAAILFHEAEWALDPNLKYSFVIDSEIKMQNFIEKVEKTKKGRLVYDSDLYQNLEVLFLDPHLSLFGAAEQDRRSGYEDLSLVDIIGQEAFNIYQKQKVLVAEATLKTRKTNNESYFLAGVDEKEMKKMRMSLKYHLYEAGKTAPDRELLKVMNKKVNGFDFTICSSDIYNWEAGGIPDYEGTLSGTTTFYTSIFIHPKTLQEIFTKLQNTKVGFRTLIDLPVTEIDEAPEYNPLYMIRHKHAQSISSELQVTVPRITANGAEAPNMPATCSVALMFNKINGSQQRIEKKSVAENMDPLAAENERLRQELAELKLRNAQQIEKRK